MMVDKRKERTETTMREFDRLLGMQNASEVDITGSKDALKRYIDKMGGAGSIDLNKFIRKQKGTKSR